MPVTIHSYIPASVRMQHFDPPCTHNRRYLRTQLNRSIAGGFHHMREREEYLQVRSSMRTFGHNVARSGAFKKVNGRKSTDYTVLFKVLRESDHYFTSWSALLDAYAPGLTQLRNYATEKFYSNTWELVPWVFEAWYMNSHHHELHALHMSENTPGNVAFAETVEKGNAERFTSIKPGRYLTRFFGGVLSEEDIRVWAEKCVASTLDAELKFIEHDDEAGWVRVYKDGPDSCMKGDTSVRVYAHGKSVLRLAYLQHGTSTIVARAIVREDLKQYVRVYPNTDDATNQKWHTKLTNALKAAGYTHGGLNGVLLQCIKTEGGVYVMPYIDIGATGDRHVEIVTREGREYFRVGSSGACADSTSGTIQMEELHTCMECGGAFPEDESTYVGSVEDRVCGGCIDEYYVHAIRNSRGGTALIRREDAIYCESNGEWYTEAGAEAAGLRQCEAGREEGEWYEEDELVSTSRGWMHNEDRDVVELDVPDSECNDYAHRADTVTTHDGRTIHVDDAEERGLKRTCHKDDEREEGEE